jgi:hypothetical protein
MKLHYTLSPALPKGSRLHRAVKKTDIESAEAFSTGEEWKYSRGHVDVPMMRQHLPPPSDDALILICGPDGLINNTAKPGLTEIGWDIENQLVVF